MATPITLPKLTHDMQTGILVQWYINEGDPVRPGEVLYAVETDKATADVEAEAEGLLAGIRAKPGDTLEVGAVLGYLAAPGEPIPAGEPPAASPPRSQPSVVMPEPAPQAPACASVPDPGDGGRRVATPLARRTAREMQVDLRDVVGSGPRGRIVRDDVLRAAQSREARAEPEAPYEVIPRSSAQRRAAERLSQMWQATPQFVLDVTVDMTEAVRWHDQMGGELSFTALLVRAIGMALRQEPQVNCLLIGDELRRYHAVNVGVAMAVRGDLVVPVIREADRLTVRDVQARLTALRTQADAGRLGLADLEGGTFTLSNLGMYGVDAFTAVINPPQVAILACGRIIDAPIASDGAVVIRPMLQLRLTVDHRALDGALAAPFLTGVKRFLETPYLLL